MHRPGSEDPHQRQRNSNYFLFQNTAIEKATAIFEKLDINDDGELNEDEFVGGCLKDESLANLLNTGASEEQKHESEDENSDEQS